MPDLILEACVTNVESALRAVDGGANRLELCSSLDAGGVTPSRGLIETVRKKIQLPLYVLIRPREGDFLYSDSEFEIMMRDVLFCREAGANGVVIGMLNADGAVDTVRCSALMESAGNLSVTFHRAFDFCSDAALALEEIIRMKCSRLLTSGQRRNALQGSAVIAGLLKQSAGRIVIMPGGGISPENIAQLRKSSGAHEFHLSARKKKESSMLFRNEYVKLGGDDQDEYSYDLLDPDILRKVRINGTAEFS